MDDVREQLYTAIAAAREQQKAAQAAIDGLAAERAALSAATQGIQKAVSEAVAGATRQSLAGASEAAVAAMTKASTPITSGMRAVAVQAQAAAERADVASRRLGLKALAFAGACIFMVAAAAWGFVAWERHEVDDLAAQKAALQAQIAQEQTTVDALSKHAGRVRWATCGDRLCFEASDNQGTAQDGSKNSLGGWTADGGKIVLVIPKGY